MLFCLEIAILRGMNPAERAIAWVKNHKAAVGISTRILAEILVMGPECVSESIQSARSFADDVQSNVQSNGGVVFPLPQDRLSQTEKR